MKSLYYTLLAEDSYFLPSVKTSNVQSVANEINLFHVHTVCAIALECLNLGEDAHLEYLKNSRVAYSYYGITRSSADNFYFGYSTPLLILAKLFTTNQALPIKNLLTETLRKYTETAVEHFKSDLNTSIPVDQPLEALPVFAYCQKNIFTEDQYFQVGIVSAETTFREVTLNLNFLEPS